MDIKAGARLDESILEALSAAKVVIVIFSSMSVISRFVMAEANYARLNNKLISICLPNINIAA